MMTNVLFAIVGILTLITIYRLMSISSLLDTIKGRKSYEITEKENNWNALLSLFMVVFGWGIYIYFYIEYVSGGKLLPEAASLHGKEIDTLWNVSFIIISIAYMLVQPVLWYFCFKYRYKSTNKAFHYSHNNKLEVAWTVFPAIIFCTLIFYGLKIWNDAVASEIEGDKITLELYARQFDWTARYAGEDKELGEANYTMISDKNSLGLLTTETIEEQLALIDTKKKELEAEMAKFPAPDKLEEMKTAMGRLIHQLKNVSSFKRENAKIPYTKAYDDVVINPGGEIHIPVGRPVELKMRSQDVIHSAYLPHFRVHMYCVPGMITGFSFVPTITTVEMQEKLQNKDFDFLLYCNNICGSAHFNMQMKIIVETEEQYNKWIKEQATLKQTLYPPAPKEEPKDTTKTELALNLKK